VSALAAGVDMVAHETALRRGGKTIAVMGTPIDQCFPKENKWLKKEIAEKGLVLSQFPPASPIHRSNFPRRNEVMALLSAVTFVVEAQIDGGTRHQVAASLTLGKKVAFLNSVAEQNFPWVMDAIQTGMECHQKYGRCGRASFCCNPCQAI
jgi:DNA processing protein